MRTNTHPQDYRQRRFSQRKHNKEMAITFTSTPVGYVNWDPELQRVWNELRDANMLVKQNQDAPLSRRRAIADAYKDKAAHFSVVYDLWWEGKPLTPECGCVTPEQSCEACRTTARKVYGAEFEEE